MNTLFYIPNASTTCASVQPPVPCAKRAPSLPDAPWARAAGLDGKMCGVRCGRKP